MNRIWIHRTCSKRGWWTFRLEQCSNEARYNKYIERYKKSQTKSIDSRIGSSSSSRCFTRKITPSPTRAILFDDIIINCFLIFLLKYPSWTGKKYTYFILRYRCIVHFRVLAKRVCACVLRYFVFFVAFRLRKGI